MGIGAGVIFVSMACFANWMFADKRDVFLDIKRSMSFFLPPLRFLVRFFVVTLVVRWPFSWPLDGALDRPLDGGLDVISNRTP